jgi:hypothetical protein
MQLQAYLDSLIHFGGVNPGAIAVLTAASDGIDYDLVESRLPEVCWVRETDFRSDLVDAVRSSSPYILFGCDDVVFKEYFDLNDCVRKLEADSDLFGFSLRLGANLNFLPRLRDEKGVFTWAWREARGEYWSYPWEVSASVYRRDAVLEFLENRPDITNPNRFEAFLAERIAEGALRVPPRLACFSRSCCLTVTVNRVQDEFPNDFDQTKDTSPEALFRQYRDGDVQDWTFLAGQQNGSVHVGAEMFRTARSIAPPERRYVLTSGKAVARSGQIGLTIKFWWWRFLIFGWENARKILPRQAIVGLKKILRPLG